MSSMGYNITYSGRYNANYSGHHGRDDNTGTDWVNTNGVKVGWWQCGTPAKRTVNKLTITARTTYQNESPKDFTLEASNTGAFSGEETTLLTVTGETGWGSSEKREWEFYNETAYYFYRVDITDTDGGPHCSMSEVELIPCSDEVISDWPPCSTYGAEMAVGENCDASSIYSAAYSCDKALDRTSTTDWCSNGGPPQWWEVKFIQARKINKVAITSGDHAWYYESPVDFTIEASNTGDFSGEEVVLVTVNDNMLWTQNETRTWEFVNDNYYYYYRMDCTANGGSNVRMQEIEMWGCEGNNPSTTSTTTTTSTTSPPTTTTTTSTSTTTTLPEEVLLELESGGALQFEDDDLLSLD
jgi:hypothetical protein